MEKLQQGLLTSPSDQKTLLKTLMMPQIAEPVSDTRILKLGDTVVNVCLGGKGAKENLRYYNDLDHQKSQFEQTSRI